jgi:hypothetical protein
MTQSWDDCTLPKYVMKTKEDLAIERYLVNDIILRTSFGKY